MNPLLAQCRFAPLSASPAGRRLPLRSPVPVFRTLLSLLILAVGSASVHAWNPYDTDSARARGDPDPWGDWSTPAVGGGEAGSRGYDQGAAEGQGSSGAPGYSDVGGSRTGFGAAMDGGGWAPVGPDPGWEPTGQGSLPRFRPLTDGGQGPPSPRGADVVPDPADPLAPAAAPPRFDGRVAPDLGDEWALKARSRYRFRGDPEGADVAPTPEGWRYRPLTDQERRRRSPDREAPDSPPAVPAVEGPYGRFPDRGGDYQPAVPRWQEPAWSGPR